VSARHSIHWGGFALTITYKGATDTTGSRLVVSDRQRARDHLRGVRRVVVPYRHDLDTDDRLRDAVQTWLDRFGSDSVGGSAVWLIGSSAPSEWVAVAALGCRLVTS